jgi:hypothetical protein
MPSRRLSLFLGLGQGDEGQEVFNHSLVTFSIGGSKGLTNLSLRPLELFTDLQLGLK